MNETKASLHKSYFFQKALFLLSMVCGPETIAAIAVSHIVSTPKEIHVCTTKG